MPKLTIKQIMAGVTDIVGKPVKIANNTVRYIRSNGDIAYRLHTTDVVICHINGTVTLDSGGWRSVTTKDRINQYAPVQVCQSKGKWFVHSPHGIFPYYDRMTIAA